MDKQQRLQALFQMFVEIGIIQQLAVTTFNRHMPEGLHVSHFGVINHMCRLGDGQTPHKLASAFQVTKATMTHTLTKLKERGFIDIRNNPEDGRSKLVFLTETGREFQGRAVAALEPFLHKVDDDLDLEKILKILPELAEIRLYLDENRDM